MADGKNARGLRLSVRFKMLLVISAVLLTAIGTYLYLATSLFTRDKLAYIYDLNSSLVQSLSEQTRASLEVLVEEASLHTLGVRGEGDPEKAAWEFFLRAPEILRLQHYKGVGPEGSYSGRSVIVNKQKIFDLGIGVRDLNFARKKHPVPMHALSLQPAQVLVQNTSLPPDAAILTVAYSNRPQEVVVMEISHERLLRVFGTSELYESYLVDSRGRILAHPRAEAVMEESDRSKHPLVIAALDARVDQGVTEFVDPESGQTFLGGYSKVGVGNLWVLSQISRDQALQASRDLIERSVLFAIAIILASFLVSIFFARYLTAPILRLRSATEVIGQGRFDVKVNVRSRDEIGELGNAFNQMAVALKKTQAQLVQSEKMAAFGQLGAGITHEVKNPMTGIVGFAQLAQRKVEDKDKTLELLKIIEKEGLRCRDILVNFLKFARSSEGEQDRLQINRVVEEAANMLKHQLNMNKVKVDLELIDGTPEVMGNAPELQQVLMNLAMNAQQAMEQGGRVRFSTTVDNGMIFVRVEDNGPGIPEEHLARIFEPFFTTKPSGEGTGLGLSVSFGIIQSHNGELSVESEMGKGTTFTIRLPVAESSRAASA